MKLALISEGTNTWPLYVAQALRFFEREGIDVDVTLTGSSVEQQRQLIDGRADVGFQQADHIVRAVERGADLFICMPFGHAPDVTFVAAPGARLIEELKGRVIAVDGARTGYALLLRRLLHMHGVEENDVEFREVGGSRERFDALKSGSVAAALLNSPFDSNLLAQGFVALARMSDAFPTYPGPVMGARRSWAAAHERELLGFIRALDAGYRWLQDRTHAREALSILPQRLAIANGAASAALERFATRARPQITPEGLQQVIDIVWDAERLTTPKSPPGKYIDISYMQRALAA